MVANIVLSIYRAFYDSNERKSQIDSILRKLEEGLEGLKSSKQPFSYTLASEVMHLFEVISFQACYVHR